MPHVRFLSVLLLVACTRGYVPTFSPIDTDGKVLRDGQGRTVILRGYNVKSAGIFDVSFDGGTPPRESVPPLDADDFAFMKQSGTNVIRLPVDWSAIEPVQGQYVTGYLDLIASLIDEIRPFGMYVLLDLHEDGWSKFLCEDGAPIWAIQPPISAPVQCVGGACICHTTQQALEAHTAFFEDVDQLQEAYIAMYEQLVTRFRDDETVFGYELMNEPIADDQSVDVFSEKLATAIRAIDTKHLILWEPSATRNITNESPISSRPFGVPGAVYAIHIYTDPGPDLTGSVTHGQQEAESWGCPLFVTEHGADPDPTGLQYVDQILDLFDQVGASSMDWIWNDGVVTRNADGTFALVYGGQVLAHLTRPYAQAVGGDIDSVAWNGTSLTVQFHGHTGVPATHDIYWNVGTPAITCDGRFVPAPKPETGLVYTLSCGGSGLHTLVFTAGNAE